MKTILSLVILSFSLSTMANEITCSGQKTSASITLSLTGKFFPLDREEYSYKNKIIEISSYEFGITANKEDQTQKLTYKFKTLTKHALAKKNSNLVLTINQINTDADPFTFIVKEAHVAELKLETNGHVTLLDKMNCK